MPPAAAQAPELAWLVALTPFPPSISGQTSRPPYKMGFRPLNKIRLPGAGAPRLRAHIGGERQQCAKKKRGSGRPGTPLLFRFSRLVAAARRGCSADNRAQYATDRDSSAGIVPVPIGSGDSAAKRRAGETADRSTCRRVGAAVAVVAVTAVTVGRAVAVVVRRISVPVGGVTVAIGRVTVSAISAIAVPAVIGRVAVAHRDDRPAARVSVAIGIARVIAVAVAAEAEVVAMMV